MFVGAQYSQTMLFDCENKITGNLRCCIQKHDFLGPKVEWAIGFLSAAFSASIDKVIYLIVSIVVGGCHFCLVRGNY